MAARAETCKIVVVEQGVCVPGKEVVFWEPLKEQGLVARERDVFEGFESPVPQTAQDAIEDKSTHEHDGDTQIYSVTFFGRNILWCKHEQEETSGESPKKKWIRSYDDYWANLPEQEYRMAFEGTFTGIAAQPKNLTWDDIVMTHDMIHVDWARDYGYTRGSRVRAERFLTPSRVVSVREPEATPAGDAFGAATYAIRDELRRMAERSMLGSIYASYHATCHPARARELHRFYSRMTPMQIGNLRVGGIESDCVIVDEA